MAQFGYARVSTDGQTLDVQVAALRAVGCSEIFKEKISGARGERKQLHRLIASLQKGDVAVVTRLDRLARSTRDLQRLTHQGTEGWCFWLAVDASAGNYQ
jgi:DNA invertase Pin-like site-specific DNA recombinase